MSKINHLENLSVVQVDFDIWSGQTSLRGEDLKLGEGGEIPPEKVAQLGSKRICDPSKLKGFHRLKTKARRLLLQYGVNFMNGYAIPIKRTQEVCDKLDLIVVEFNKLKQEFINNYNNAIDEWVRENPEYENALRSGALPLRVVEERIGLDYQVFMIQAVNGDVNHEQRLSNKVQQLGNDLISEVIQTANDFYSTKLAGREHCAATTNQTLKNLRNKIDGLSFLNGKLCHLVKLLDETIAGYKVHVKGKNISAPFFYQVMSAVLILCDYNKINAYIEGKISPESMSQTLISNVYITEPITVEASSIKDESSIAITTTNATSVSGLSIESELDLYFSKVDKENPVEDAQIMTNVHSENIVVGRDLFF